MRTKENSDSWRESGILKRDFKYDHSEPYKTGKCLHCVRSSSVEYK
jgi:hypothetical protein